MAQSGVPQLKRLVPHLPYGYMVPKSNKSTDTCYATLRYMPECAAVVDLSSIASKLRFPVQTTPPVNWVSDPILTNGKRKPHTLQRTLRNQQLFACSQHARLGNQLSSGAARPCFALPRLKLVSLLRLLTFLPGATCRRSWCQPTGSTDGRSALALSRDSTVRVRDFVHFHFVFLQW
ncbi:hypothetical protein JMJ76_0002265 [Colletotrichum scovillei]|nr:hypothetical protein JMJ76_0002265 [Colletotrichum scovillei]KAG7079267.1 hypothetical protein JMJ78_0002923 [Colletotrichum scovillei]